MNTNSKNDRRSGYDLAANEGSSVASNWAAVTPADLVRSVFQRLPSVFFTALLVVVIVIGVLVAWPNKYGSDGMMYVRLGRAALSIDPTATTNSGSQGVSVQETREAEVSSVAEMVNSREIAERIVQVVGADRINEPRSWIDRAGLQVQAWMPKSGKNAPDGMTVQEYDQQLDRENAVRRVQDWLKVTVPKKGYTVAIEAGGPDPKLIQEIAQAAMDQYKLYHVEAHRSDGSLEFFEQQVGDSRQAAIDARQALQSARSEMGWMSIESAEQTLRDRIVNLEVALDEAESKYAETQQRSETLLAQLSQTKAWIPTEVTKGVANVASDTMRTQLFGEQVEESAALATLTPDHPKYRMLKQKMDRNAEIAAAEKTPRELSREAINPVRQQLEGEYTLAAASATGLKSKCDSLRKSLANANESLLRLNRDAVTLAQLKWEADIDERTLMEHSKSLEEARVIAELDRKNMSDVSIIQNASLNLKKIGPPRALLAIVGAALGLMLGILQALLRDTSTLIGVNAVSEDRRRGLREGSGESRIDGPHSSEKEQLDEALENQPLGESLAAAGGSLGTDSKVLPR